MVAQCSFSLESDPVQETPFGQSDVIQLSSPESAFDHDDGETWSCPHPATDGAEYCVFHLGPDEVTSQELVDAFIDAVEDSNCPSEFRGARMDGLSVPGQTLEPEDGHIDLRHVIASDDLDFTDTTIEGDLLLTDAAVDANIRLSDATISGRFICRDATLDRRVLLHRAQMRSFDWSGLECGYLGAQELEIDGYASLDRFT